MLQETERKKENYTKRQLNKMNVLDWNNARALDYWQRILENFCFVLLVNFAKVLYQNS